jgi:hypothetical protein
MTLSEIEHVLSRIKNQSFKRLITAVWSEVPGVIKFLQDSYGIKPVIIGGLAVQYHGLTRMTEDLDLLVSRVDYDKLKADGKISYGTLRYLPGYQVDVIWEGRDGNPNPESVRQGDSVYPTLLGLLCLKLISGRGKDQGDIIELIKIHEFDENLKQDVLASGLINQQQKDLFEGLWITAEKEQEKVENLTEEENV